MSTGNRQAAFNFEEKLADLHLTSTQRNDAAGAARVAEGVIEVAEFLAGLVKRLAEAVSLKPSVRT